jgi:hypothetical protein
MSTSDFEPRLPRRRFSCVRFLSLASSSSPPSLAAGGGAATHVPFDCCTSEMRGAGLRRPHQALNRSLRLQCESLSLLLSGHHPLRLTELSVESHVCPFSFLKGEPGCAPAAGRQGGRAGSRFGSWLIVGMSLPVKMRWATGATWSSWPWPSRPVPTATIQASCRPSGAPPSPAGSQRRHQRVVCVPRGESRDRRRRMRGLTAASGFSCEWCVKSGAIQLLVLTPKCCTFAPRRFEKGGGD